MRTFYSKKVNRFRRWLARNTQNLVVHRSSCRMCSEAWVMAWIISRDHLQSFIHRPGEVERRDATTIQQCTCGQGNTPFGTEGPAILEIWDNNQTESRYFIPSLPYRASGDAT